MDREEGWTDRRMLPHHAVATHSTGGGISYFGPYKLCRGISLHYHINRISCLNSKVVTQFQHCSSGQTIPLIDVRSTVPQLIPTQYYRMQCGINRIRCYVRIQVLQVNDPVKYSSTGSRHATVLLQAYPGNSSMSFDRVIYTPKRSQGANFFYMIIKSKRNKLIDRRLVPGNWFTVYLSTVLGLWVNYFWYCAIHLEYLSLLVQLYETSTCFFCSFSFSKFTNIQLCSIVIFYSQYSAISIFSYKWEYA